MRENGEMDTAPRLGGPRSTVEVAYVDDDSTFAELVVNGLELAGDIDARSIPDAESLLVVLNDVDCVVCRYDLPDGTAPALVDRIHQRRPTLPVILFSEATPREVDEAVSAGVTDHLRRSADVARHERLADRVRAAVAESRAKTNYREVFEKVDAGLVVYHPETGMVDDVNQRFCEMLGYDRETLLDRSLADITIAADETGRERARTHIADAVDGEPQRFEARARTAAGAVLWVEIQLKLATIDGERRLLAILRDIEERKRHEHDLEDERAFVESILDGLPDVLYTVGEGGEILRWNDRVNAVTGYTDEEIAGTTAFEFVPERDHDRIMAAIAAVVDEGESVTVESHLLTSDGEELPYEFTGAPVTDADGDVVGLTGIGRDISERTEREALLERQRDELERLDRINGVIRGVLRSLVDAESRETIEQRVCDRLADSETYRFAWVGDRSGVDGRVVPRASAGVEAGYLDDIDITVDDADTGRGPAGRAVRTREVSVAQRIDADPDFAPWRADALERGYRSSAAVPLVSGETLYGVLNIYADRPNAFDEEERAVLRELGETVGYAIAATERKRALVSDAVVELELTVEDAPPFTALAGATGSHVVLDGVVGRPDGTFVLSVTVEGCDDETALVAAESVETVQHASVAGTVDDAVLLEVLVDDDTLVPVLVESGATVRDLYTDGEETALLVDVAERADVRGIVDTLSRVATGVRLVARRERDRPLKSRNAFRAELDDRLTERQATTLEAAYQAGYFERPRRHSGQEVADLLDISASTFTQHLRAAERKLLGVLYEPESE
ncbi:PAS domain S-box protein [Halomarina oriensis]|uniref:PAS domain S-box protein n=1 Tax=Halomarina oriensis TaxID=671145 RepID=A0A6B0GNI0_9EURY|nr:PAS domain S-box protein [Halomarina oriensis]MWG34233.1 PAS domain S-box protein [Halomarina oriensis]